MKKANFFLFLVLLGLTLTSFTRMAPDDFFAGKWEITVVGTPNGDAKMTTELVRKDGKLTGELKPAGEGAEALPISKIEEEKEKLTIYFDHPQASGIAMELTKVDDDHLKGSVMGSFEATAVRVKQ